jgi:hypothetical protein
VAPGLSTLQQRLLPQQQSEPRNGHSDAPTPSSDSALILLWITALILERFYVVPETRLELVSPCERRILRVKGGPGWRVGRDGLGRTITVERR